ncbi:ABC transporter permease [Paenibacillus sp. N4]|uniref:ABC transporter permease n=1 Tax=Paenibacillus vietnamensis TaxID=2590547 RepID=UPI001CD141C2|nr:FtsX-like permease family protein [Paenibacillus vietnamensis]MCA0755610.1 ABC transporter permease [Paenibacillus vietnamensis]
MALLIMILRKMIKNKWLQLSLLFGLVLTVALSSSIPIYTNAILQRMLSQELQNLQSDSGQYPGTYWLSADNPTAEGKSPQDGGFFSTDDYLSEKASGRFGLPVQQFARERASDVYSFLPSDTERMDVNKIRWANFAAISDLEQHVKLKDGRLPKKEPEGGVYEALVVPEALTELNLVLGNVFTIKDDNVKTEISVKPVGVIEPSDYADLFWYNSTVSYKSSFLIDLDLFDKSFTEGQALKVKASYWYFALDYTKMTLSTAKEFIAENGRITAHMKGQYDTYSKNAPALRTLSLYKEKEAKLKILLLSLNVPVMLMLGFYLYMVANLITDRQKTEIAVLRSRGASRLQIVLGYTVEGLVLGIIAFFAGPYVGVMITKVLGASSGFLEFVQRAKLHAEVGKDAFQYALIAVVLSLIMTLIPVLLATRFSIVAHKQQMARVQKQSFWHKYFIDIILIGVSLYGLQSYETRMSKLLSIGANTADLSIDPLLFLIPAFFVLGLALSLLRLYPWFIRLVYLIGRRWWPPSLYYTLIQVGRTSASFKFIMVFMIITIATGIFSASANRTINKNVEDKIDYRIGADITMKVHWESDAPPILLSGGAGGEEGEASEENGSSVKAAPRKTQYSEPSFLPFTQMPDVEHAAKVFIKQDASYYTQGNRNKEGTSKRQEQDKVKLMGIDTYEFGMTAWLRDGLLDYTFNSYLNLLASEPSAVLISRSMALQHGLKTGDLIQLGWYGADTAEFIIYGIVDYWPTWNPGTGGISQPAAGNGGNEARAAMPNLVIGNLSYIQNNIALEPYEVWLKLKEGATSQHVYQAITDKGYDITSLSDANQERIRAVNDPFQLAINGVMTLDFLISIVITFVGFLLYWVLSLLARTLQFGILRAMGISFFQLIGMLVAEQLLISGAAIGLGILNGNLTSRLFVRLFEMSFDPKTQILPFEVTFNPSDQIGLYIIVTIMMLLGIGILGLTVSRIRIHQALKLGED